MSTLLRIFWAVIFLQACAPFTLYQGAYSSGINYFFPKDIEIDENIKNIPYAMQLVEMGGQQALMILAFSDKQRLTWVDSQNNSLVTLDGKIIQTNGLENDIEVMNPPEILKIASGIFKNFDGNFDHNSFIRFKDPTTNFLEINYSYKLVNKTGDYFIRRIDGEKIKYNILEEYFNVPSIRWSGKNTYWVSDQSILKSKQSIFPFSNKYHLETIKDFLPNT